jgi:hypothetical protein
LQIGDTVSGEGPRINSQNFSDEEITALLGLASNKTDVVVAQIFTILATEWTRMAMSYTIGPRKEDYTKIADLYSKKSIQWSVIAGTLNRAFSSGTIRTNHDVDTGVT